MSQYECIHFELKTISDGFFIQYNLDQYVNNVYLCDEDINLCTYCHSQEEFHMTN